LGRRVHNFSAGPSTLPLEVLEEAQQELVDYEGSGMSLLEMSHRGGPYERVHTEALGLVREIGGIPDDFDVLFMQGGATLQFAAVPANLLGRGGRAGYVLSGSWGRKAFADAERLGEAYAAWDGGSAGHSRMPRADELDLRPGTRYLHLTSNETIEGIRYADWPDVDVPLVADASSEFFSRPMPWERFDVVYAGTQKNLGPAGMAVVVVRRAVLDEAPETIGTYLRYATHAKADSLYNTPPSFTVYVTGKVLRWIKAHGGLEAMEERAERKAGIVYEAIDGSDGFYTCPAEVASRSRMNVVFRLPNEDDERDFLARAGEAGLVNLKGHRSVGGCRASLYNALPEAGAQALAEFMADFRAGRR
jgi:phosphoserine aminotransferase